MKRTKESYYKYHPEWEQRQGVSGLKDFDGEDLDFEARIKFQKQQQKEWIQQQMNEKAMRDNQEKAEEMAYAQQTLELNRMRGMLEDNFNLKKKQMREAQSNFNQDQAKEKNDNFNQQKNDKLNYEQNEVRETLRRGQKLGFP